MNDIDKLNEIKRYSDLNNLPDMRRVSNNCHQEFKQNYNGNFCNRCVDSEICAYREICKILNL